MSKNTKNSKPVLRFIYHPSHTKPDALKTRMLCQLIAAVKGNTKYLGNKEKLDKVAFHGTAEEEQHIQALADYHIPRFWQLVELLYHDYVERNELYLGEARIDEEDAPTNYG